MIEVLGSRQKCRNIGQTWYHLLYCFPFVNFQKIWAVLSKKLILSLNICSWEIYLKIYSVYRIYLKVCKIDGKDFLMKVFIQAKDKGNNITNIHVPTIHLKIEGIWIQMKPVVHLSDWNILPASGVWISHFSVHIFLCTFMIQVFDWCFFKKKRLKRFLPMYGYEFLSWKVLSIFPALRLVHSQSVRFSPSSPIGFTYAGKRCLSEISHWDTIKRSLWQYLIQWIWKEVVTCGHWK